MANCARPQISFVKLLHYTMGTKKNVAGKRTELKFNLTSATVGHARIYDTLCTVLKNH